MRRQKQVQRGKRHARRADRRRAGNEVDAENRRNRADDDAQEGHGLHDARGTRQVFLVGGIRHVDLQGGAVEGEDHAEASGKDQKRHGAELPDRGKEETPREDQEDLHGTAEHHHVAGGKTRAEELAEHACEKEWRRIDGCHQKHIQRLAAEDRDLLIDQKRGIRAHINGT